MLDIVFIFLSAGFVTFVSAGILLTVFKKEIAFNERVSKFFGEPIINQKKESLRKRNDDRLRELFNQYWNKGTDLLNQKVSKEERKKLDILLRDAGYPFKSAIDFRLFQFVLSIGLSVPIVLFLLPAADNKMSVWMIAIIMAILGFRLPVFQLGKKKTARVKEINKAMPDFFDTVTLLLEAGMGLDLAIAEVAKKGKGPLSEEFLQTLEDMKLGKSRREAFYDLRKRVPSDSFQSIITSLIQADQLGIGMAKALGNLTVRVREQRREAAREQAMKAPVKMLFPMVFFIFPSLFIIILGPLVIQLVTKGLGV
ncbi:type II secretion system F family protein [Neobacillus massiliamazoniensis]|uniref:Bacterial type II secretion system protein F domain protein n=1 Tax=Neobacillus massiliamazoniensis TaxID=1499688 RepID=A0A0U1NU04_9BACI|nr:type II secretion system F family protein [Neobacillus massiliamazoniensis]CRK81541.1 Bacterial type II secretion system protein F domain protein [Neobacillus massiliamazoniensis]